LLQELKKEIAWCPILKRVLCALEWVRRRAQQKLSVVTAAGDEMEISGGIVAFQARGHWGRIVGQLG
jgi:hypothetical protein